MKWRLYIAYFLLFLLGSLSRPQSIFAARPEVLGIHILHPYELPKAVDLLSAEDEKENWRYVTIPLSIDDLESKTEWQDFFDRSKAARVQPIVRLVTSFEDGAWKIPDRKEITELIAFLSELNWPREERYIIVLNEVNHAPEFGGKIDPREYADILEFVTSWAKTEGKSYKVLPAALDLAASDTAKTAEAFGFLTQMLEYKPELLEQIDYWNSHSYPNPGFSTSPLRTDKRSLWGFSHELAFLKQYSQRDFKVFITETGWVENSATRYRLNDYYSYAFKNIWSDERVVAVTPFLLQGAPGPFAGFSFIDESGKPTLQYLAYRSLINTSVN